MFEALRTAIRVLFFRATREELLALDYRHLALGLLFTWVVGMGRHWDHIDIVWHQKLGLHSVGYVFVLALLLYVVAWPLAAKGWTYPRVLTYVMLTAPPGIIYAVPVERQFSFDTAYMLNLYFLLGVSIWRVAMWFRLLYTFGQLPFFQTVIIALLPLSVISTYAAITGKVAELFIGAMAGNGIMGGYRHVEVTDGVKQFLGMLVIASICTLVIVGPIYIMMLIRKSWEWYRSEQDASTLSEPPVNTDKHR